MCARFYIYVTPLQLAIKPFKHTRHIPLINRRFCRRDEREYGAYCYNYSQEHHFTERRCIQEANVYLFQAFRKLVQPSREPLPLYRPWQESHPCGDAL